MCKRETIVQLPNTRVMSLKRLLSHSLGTIVCKFRPKTLSLVLIVNTSNSSSVDMVILKNKCALFTKFKEQEIFGVNSSVTLNTLLELFSYGIAC